MFEREHATSYELVRKKNFNSALTHADKRIENSFNSC